ncbi:hypothetical protein B296_00022794 [Ensete ventricosum]|uniref:Uncharacterized protein n=1 Tax=Ensete ventricosum TaxID=4639 RepID=A0A426ZEQ2_ENSVE|nr:hypothetical protein B296_00022794 [Ensete ventricosum]
MIWLIPILPCGDETVAIGAPTRSIETDVVGTAPRRPTPRGSINARMRCASHFTLGSPKRHRTTLSRAVRSIS